MAIAKFTIEMAADIGQLKRDISNINSVVSNMGKQMSASYQPGLQSLKAVGDAHKKIGEEAGLSAAAQQRAARLTQYQNVQLANQLQDFAIQIAGGQNPLLAFAQQGSQLSAVYGGVGNAFRAVTRLMTPMTLSIGAAGAAVLGLGAAFLKGDEQSAVFRRSLELTGNAAGMTAGRFESMVISVSASADLGAGKVRDMAQALVSSGRFGSAGFEDLAKTASIMAQVTGKSAEQVVQELTGMADAPASWAASQNKALHFMTDAQLKYVETLEANGRREEAVQVVKEALSKRYTDKHIENLGLLARAAKSTSKVFDDAWDVILGIGREDTIEEQIVMAMTRLDKARAYAESIKNGGIDMYNAGGYVGSVEAAEKRLQDLYDKKSSLALKASQESTAAADEQAATEKRRLQERLQSMVLSITMSKNEANARLQLLDIEKRITEIQRGATTDSRDLEGQQQAAQQIGEQKLLEMAMQRRKVLQDIATVKAQPQDKPEQALAVQQQLIGLNSKLVEMDTAKLGLQSQAFAGYVQQLQSLQEIRHAQEFSLSLVGKTVEQSNALVFADSMRVQTSRAIQAEQKNLADGLIDLTELERRKAEIQRQAGMATLAFYKLQADEIDRAFNANRGVQDAIKKYIDETQRSGELASQATRSVLSSMEDSFANFFKTGKLDAKSFVDTLINEFLRLQVIKPMMNNIMSSGGGDFLSTIFGGGSSGGGKVNNSAGLSEGFQSGNTAFAANGAVFSPRGITHTFAKGGAFTNQVITHPKRFAFAGGAGLMGEAGPEAIIPLRRDSRGRLGVGSLGGGASNVTVQVINQGGSALQVTGQTQSRGADGSLNVSVLVSQMQDALADGVASGTGSLYHAIGSRFAAQRGM